ncbi:hypothetical protein [Zavarzinia sp. CC-PAN008]|uniref:hypothetical protein n=1 Tax=Zavarzinia sp. CC-PAN008 TaxID=3243332 RepID=UPI003F744186
MSNAAENDRPLVRQLTSPVQESRYMESASAFADSLQSYGERAGSFVLAAKLVDKAEAQVWAKRREMQRVLEGIDQMLDQRRPIGPTNLSLLNVVTDELQAALEGLDATRSRADDLRSELLDLLSHQKSALETFAASAEGKVVRLDAKS